MALNPNRLRRYHKDIFFPKELGNMLGEFISQFRIEETSKDPEPTYHAAEELLEDKKAQNHGGQIPLPTREELFNNNNTLVEFYEVLDRESKPLGKIQKAVIRIHNLHSKLDYTYVVAREGFVVSAWANDKNDKHRLTESKDAYYAP